MEKNEIQKKTKDKNGKELKKKMKKNEKKEVKI